MKKIIYLFALPLIFIYACNDDLSNSVETGPSILKFENHDIELLQMDQESISKYFQKKEEAGNEIYQKSRNNQKAIGMVKRSNDLINLGYDKVTFNAVKNKGGLHGHTHLSGKIFKNVKFDTECLYILDNKAYWGGTITTWEVDENIFPNYLGWNLYASAIDNGEGSGSSPDEMGDALILFPPGYDSTVYGFETWCHFADYDYTAHKHSYYEGDKPTNIQID